VLKERMMDFAILAPVPFRHLDSGKEVSSAEGFVCFGSNDFEFFREVDELRATDPVPVLFYQSHDPDGKARFETLWFGWYEGRVEDTAEKRRLEAAHRPPTTMPNPDDNASGWGTFYKVRGLRPLEPHERLPFYKLTLFKSGRKKMASPPRGPLLIDRPTSF
jgi:hypothetical protein